MADELTMRIFEDLAESFESAVENALGECFPELKGMSEDEFLVWAQGRDPRIEYENSDLISATIWLDGVRHVNVRAEFNRELMAFTVSVRRLSPLPSNS